MTINERECAKARLDPQAVRKIARRLERVGHDAHLLGLTLFFGSSTSLRFTDYAARPPLIIASLELPNTDGGDGGSRIDDEGYERGE